MNSTLDRQIPEGLTIDDALRLISENPETTFTENGKPNDFSFNLDLESDARALSVEAEEARGFTVPIIGDYWDIIKDATKDLVDEKEFEKVGVFGFAYRWLKKKIFGYLSKKALPPEKRKGGFLVDYIGSKLDLWANESEGDFRLAVEKSFPGMLKFIPMFNGSTDIAEMYTVRHAGKDFAIHMKRKGGEEPADETLLENIAFVQQNGRSPYYKTTRPKGKPSVQAKGGCDLKSLLNDDFMKKSIKEFTSGDSENFGPIREPVYEWVARFDTWLIYQYGKRSTKNVGSHTVTVHKRPGALRLGSAYMWGDVINSAASGATKAYADATKIAYGMNSAADFLLDTKYKGVFRSLMGFFNPRAGIFAYE